MNSFENFNILIVDDEELLRATLSKILKLNGYKTFEACGGKMALDMIRDNKINFIISDVRMPKGDGISLLKNIKNIRSHKPAIIMTSGFSEYSREYIIKLGAIDLLEKPIDMDLLVSVIEKYRKNN